jgi:hypothetical protein
MEDLFKGLLLFEEMLGVNVFTVKKVFGAFFNFYSLRITELKLEDRKSFALTPDTPTQ